MPLSVLSAFIVFSFITAFTPGPNNILALNSGIQLGFRKTIPLLLGISSAFICVMIICCGFVYSLSSFSENFQVALKYVGCIYIAWLSIKIAITTNNGDEKNRQVSSFFSGFLLQFVNIKIYIYGITAFSGFIIPYYDSIYSLIIGALVLTFIGSSGTIAWAVLGTMLQSFYRAHTKFMNISMAAMLLLCIIPMI